MTDDLTEKLLAVVPAWLAESSDPASAPLLPWQAVYAEWLSIQPTKPSTVQQRKIASQFCQRPVSLRELHKLRTNPRFESYLLALQADSVRRARAIIEEHYAEGVHAHIDGMRMAKDAADYKALPAFTVPLLDRVVPKKEAVAAQTQINVTLSTKQQAQLTEQPMEVEYEVLPPSAVKT